MSLQTVIVAATWQFHFPDSVPAISRLLQVRSRARHLNAIKDAQAFEVETGGEMFVDEEVFSITTASRAPIPRSLLPVLFCRRRRWHSAANHMPVVCASQEAAPAATVASSDSENE